MFKYIYMLIRVNVIYIIYNDYADIRTQVPELKQKGKSRIPCYVRKGNITYSMLC